MSRMEVTPLLNDGAESYVSLSFIKRALAVITVLLTVGVAVSVPTVVWSKRADDKLRGFHPENPVDGIIHRVINQTLDLVIPTRYSVPEKYLMPPSDQGNRGTCWGVAAMDHFGSQYRAYGIDHGFLDPDEYVSFSKQAYLKFLLDRCIANPRVAPCQHGGFATNSTEDHKIDAIYYFLHAFPDLATSVLPEAVCPYQVNEVGHDICDGFDAAIRTNPISFKIKSLKAAPDIEGTKRLLIEAGRPLGIGLPIDRYRFYAPCDGSNYSTSVECVNRTTKCPAGYTSEFCKIVDLDARIRDGTYGFIDDVARARPSGGHAMNIVGYNDDWVYRTRRSAPKSLSNMRGGFVMHNSWADPGHSVDFLMGRLSDENEAVQCPNHLNPANWIPTTSLCLIVSRANVSACGTGMPRVRGRGLTKHVDVLKCKNALRCNLSRNYALADRGGDVDVQPLFSGFDRIHLISWTSADDITDEYIDWLPFWALRTILEPREVVPNVPGLCGYWMYPYDAIALVNRVQWSLLDTFHASDTVFEFTNASFARSPQRDPTKNYTLLEQSTFRYNRIAFEGPLPYKIVY